MRSSIATIAVVAVLAGPAGTALAMPAGEAPDAASAVPDPVSLRTDPPQQQLSGGTEALTIGLIGAGGVLAMACAASVGVHVGRRTPRLPHSGT